MTDKISWTDGIDWVPCSFEYDPEKDSIMLYSERSKDKKEVMGILHRNVLLKMIGLLPGNPPSIYKR